MTAYSIAQLLKYKGKHDIQIYIIDNNAMDGSIKYFAPFVSDIKYDGYPKEMLQSHGIAFDYILPYIKTEYFITLESDSFPTNDTWLDYYEKLIEEGYDAAGSLMKLSGGTYHHPCGMLYKKSIWEEAKAYCDSQPYTYFPNMSRRLNFDCHLMVHNSILEQVLDAPEDWVELSNGYKGLTKEQMLAKADYYKPCTQPFHNGMGGLNEDVLTYGLRNIINDSPHILLEGKRKIINRIGYEPGEWLSFWMAAMGKKVFSVPTETKWLPNREGQQQEYSIMENGLYHCWGISSYTERSAEGVEDIAKAKIDLPEILYNTLPEHQKIKQ